MLIVPFMAWLVRRHRDEPGTPLLLWTATVCLVIAGLNVLLATYLYVASPEFARRFLLWVRGAGESTAPD